jgi:hypothetical protein
VLGDAGKGSLPQGPFDRVLLVTVLGEIMDQRPRWVRSSSD